MSRQILLTGATGFVGRRIYPALVEAGFVVRCMTRHVDQARQRWPKREWVGGDVADEAAARKALRGCEAALFLVHAMGEGGDFGSEEVAAAGHFSRAAAGEDVRRIVYLGGVSPKDGERASVHLQSRIEVGKALRAGRVPTIELRASMIVGHGSLSWTIVRDLAARLPFMVLPRWLRSRTEPVAIDDVVLALVKSLDLPDGPSEAYDVPGPDVLSGRQILEHTARVMGHAPPRMIEVPLLSPRLSSYWVHFVSRAEWKVAREVVLGLEHDLLARDARFWQLIGHDQRLGFDEAARRALAEEHREGAEPAGAWGAVERALEQRTP